VLCFILSQPYKILGNLYKKNLVDERVFPGWRIQGGFFSLSRVLQAKKPTPQTSFEKGCDRRDGFCRGSSGFSLILRLYFPLQDVHDVPKSMVFLNLVI